MKYVHEKIQSMSAPYWNAANPETFVILSAHLHLGQNTPVPLCLHSWAPGLVQLFVFGKS